MTPYAFFYRWAGWSYQPATETPPQGRARCAKALATAERRARGVLTFEWSIDPISTSLDWCDERPAWQQWECVARNVETGRVVASLHAIDFGRDGEPWGDPYRRVVEAELASEAID